ncbi:MAG: protein containing Coagulation factor 5/8 type, partial [Verrucomicrobiae bacterium]|nr:protein containing Coagulation factor 5/8 type [Verrucomicrobiae bacterium]
MAHSLPSILFLILATTAASSAAAEENRAPWPAGRIVPAFAKPAAKLDALVVQDLGPDELITFSSLQGRVNLRRPRFILLDNRAGEGRDTWLRTPTTGIGEVEVHEARDRFDLIAKYSGELRGVVLYDVSRSEHYRNLAGTVAALEDALPVTRETLAAITARGWKPGVVADLTEWKEDSAVGIYRRMHTKYWPRCTKRLIVSARPFQRNGDLHHTRDMAAACGAAVLWLDPREKDERELLGEFFHDMPAGDAVALGWYATERSGITTASEYGIGTMPADFFNGSTVFAASPGEIRIPPVPRMPALENKVHIAVFISDGDNIQYVQHAMRQAWDGCSGVRGRIPLNWTIAPGLVDIAPGLMNYDYDAASPNDCFV